MTSNVALAQPFSQYDPQARKRLLSNSLAQAYATGAPLEKMKEYDRPGLSRGRGQMNQAGIDSARAIADGVRNAYAQDDAFRTAQATSQLNQNAQQEQYAQQLSALQQQDLYSRQMAALNARQQRLNFATGLLGGLLR